MNEAITILQVKEKVDKAEKDISMLLSKLQEETTINIKGITMFLNQVEVARNDEMKLKIEYEL